MTMDSGPKDKTEHKEHKKQDGPNTRLMNAGRTPQDYAGIVNTPPTRGSTILYPSLEAYENHGEPHLYGRFGTPITRNFESAMTQLEGGFNAVITPSGSCAITTSLLAFLKAGDHLLMVDTVYGPTRDFCENILKRYGIETQYYAPQIGAEIKGLIRENTAMIYMESPGSATFDIQDVPAITRAAKEKHILTMIDNVWSSGILFHPFEHGVDIIIHSASKYIGGHSDIMMGIAIARTEDLYIPLKKAATEMGICAGPDDIYLALRGLRTLPLRLKQAADNAMKVIAGIKSHQAIERIYYPALPEDPNHALWRRDFKGANGLFSLLLKPTDKQTLRIAVDSLKLFPIGLSWGGYESLVLPQDLKTCRTITPWEEEGAFLRFHVGLEDPEDLISDLTQALDRLTHATE